MKRFGLIGVGGYIAPRHLQAIKETGNELVVALDVNDSVGIMDSHFPDAEFFTEFEQFEAFVEDERLRGKRLDYIVICSPNYLHAAHIKFSLKNGIDVICEKPLVLNSFDLNSIKEYEQAYGARVNSILQLRLHPSILALREKVQSAAETKIFDVRPNLPHLSWKVVYAVLEGADQKSGGVATNIGVHFYDMLHFIFGPLVNNQVYHRDEKTCSGWLAYERARVRWFLSIDAAHLPENAVQGEKMTYRSITVEGEELEFSGGFTDLHTRSYQSILEGKGYGVDENRTAIETVEAIRSLSVNATPEHPHPLLSSLIK